MSPPSCHRRADHCFTGPPAHLGSTLTLRISKSTRESYFRAAFFSVRHSTIIFPWAKGCIFNYSGTYRNVDVIRHKGARSCVLNNYERGTRNRNQTKGQRKGIVASVQYLIPWKQRKEKKRHCTHFPTRKQHCLEKGLSFKIGEACACSSMLQWPELGLVLKNLLLSWT